MENEEIYKKHFEEISQKVLAALDPLPTAGVGINVLHNMLLNLFRILRKKEPGLCRGYIDVIVNDLIKFCDESFELEEKK